MHNKHCVFIGELAKVQARPMIECLLDHGWFCVFDQLYMYDLHLFSQCSRGCHELVWRFIDYCGGTEWLHLRLGHNAMALLDALPPRCRWPFPRDPLQYACLSGNWMLVQHHMEHFREQMHWGMLFFAALSGNYEFAQRIYDLAPCNSSLLDIFVQAGYNEGLEKILKQAPNAELDGCFSSALRVGNLFAAQLLYTKPSSLPKDYSLDDYWRLAACSNNVALLEWFCGIAPAPFPATIWYHLGNVSVEVYRWLDRKVSVPASPQFVASDNYCQDVMESFCWRVAHGHIPNLSDFLMASEEGNLGTLKQMLARRVPWSSRVFSIAAGNGYLDNMEWLFANDCPTDAQALVHAITGSFGEYPKRRSLVGRAPRLLVVRWLLEHGWEVDEYSLRTARDPILGRGCSKILLLLEQYVKDGSCN